MSSNALGHVEESLKRDGELLGRVDMFSKSVAEIVGLNSDEVFAEVLGLVVDLGAEVQGIESKRQYKDRMMSDMETQLAEDYDEDKEENRTQSLFD